MSHPLVNFIVILINFIVIIITILVIILANIKKLFQISALTDTFLVPSDLFSVTRTRSHSRSKAPYTSSLNPVRRHRLFHPFD